MPEINVNINGDDAERAAQAADEAALRAEAAAAMGNATANRLERAQASYGLPQLKAYQQALKKYGTTAGGAHALTPLAPSPQGTVKPRTYLNANAAHRFSARAIQTGFGGTPLQSGGAGGVNNALPKGTGGGAAPLGGASQPLSGWRQAGWGTNKANLSNGSGIGGNFGKSAIGGTSSAKARSLYNLASGLGNGSMPVILRMSLALWMTQKAAQVGGQVWETGMKGVNASGPPEMAAQRFSENMHAAIGKQIKQMGQGLAQGAIDVTKFALVGVAGLAGLAAHGPALAYFLGGGDRFNKVSGAVLQWGQQQISKLETYYTGKSSFVRGLNEIAAADRALSEAVVEARKNALAYIGEFADRNADELAALGFGSGPSIRGLVGGLEASKKLARNAELAVLRKAGEDVGPDFEPSAGDD
jgi:hypothetical protein